MKLLLDNNLSRRLLPDLDPAFAASSHVQNLGLECADDGAIWAFARANDFVVVTFDADFAERSALLGFPPKVVWLRCGNSSTAHVRALLLSRRAWIENLGRDPEVGCLPLR